VIDPRLLWPEDQRAAAVLALSRSVGGATGLEGRAPELVPVMGAFTELSGILDRAAPALLRIGVGEQAPVLALLGGGPVLQILGPEGPATLPREAVIAQMGAGVRESLMAERRALLQALPPAAAAALSRVWLAEREVFLGWILRQPADASLGALLQEAGAIGLIGRLVAAAAGTTLLGLLGLGLTGGAALAGTLRGEAVILWLLLALSALPLQLQSARWRGELGLKLGLLFRRRLLLGITRLRPEELRLDGLGGHLGRMIDAAQVEGLALGVGLSALSAPVDLLLAGALLASAPGGGLLLLAFVVAIGLVIGLAGLTYRRLRREVRARQRLTRGLIERMNGHQTRLAALSPDRWHAEEDAELRPYAEAAVDHDRASLALQMAAGPGFLALGVLALLPTLVAGAPAPALAIGVAGLMLGAAALGAVQRAADQLTGALLAYERVGLLWRAAERGPLGGAVEPGPVFGRPPAAGEALLEAVDLHYQPPGRPRAVLGGVSLRVEAGDRVLIEGESGAGKSTLAAILAGHLRPQSGLLLLRGLDLSSLGEAPWRRAVVLAPQFHDNHIFSQSLLFNLRLGCAWPADAAAVEETQALCEEIGLGPLLAQMPSGLMQPVGETGWQLSHGERSRIFLARALLAAPQVVILDESFAALDPQTLAAALAAARRRAHTLLVIAHP
jgi:ATP-binding cassette subfamily B protein